VKIESDGSVVVYGGKELGERYLLRLIHCMEKLFLDKNKVVPSLVSDVDQYVYKVAGKYLMDDTYPFHLVLPSSSPPPQVVLV
jgi:hypothetical protein